MCCLIVYFLRVIRIDFAPIFVIMFGEVETAKRDPKFQLVENIFECSQLPHQTTNSNTHTFKQHTHIHLVCRYTHRKIPVLYANHIFRGALIAVATAGFSYDCVVRVRRDYDDDDDGGGALLVFAFAPTLS